MHTCDRCGMDCDCERGLPGCEHLCNDLCVVNMASEYRIEITEEDMPRNFIVTDIAEPRT